jgi:hypothetical protein
MLIPELFKVLVLGEDQSGEDPLLYFPTPPQSNSVGDVINFIL